MKYIKFFESYSGLNLLTKLGFKDVIEIAQNIFTCSDKDTILKISDDYITANTMMYIKNHIKHPNIIRIKDVYKVGSLYVIESENLDRLDIEVDYEKMNSICESLGFSKQIFGENDLMKRGDDVVIVDIRDISLPKQHIKKLNHNNL